MLTSHIFFRVLSGSRRIDESVLGSSAHMWKAGQRHQCRRIWGHHCSRTRRNASTTLRPSMSAVWKKKIKLKLLSSTASGLC